MLVFNNKKRNFRSGGSGNLFLREPMRPDKGQIQVSEDVESSPLTHHPRPTSLQSKLWTTGYGAAKEINSAMQTEIELGCCPCDIILV